MKRSRRPPRRRLARPLDEQLSLVRRASRGLVAAPWNAIEMRLIESGAWQPPAPTRLPDFLGIGTPQSGTTWLFDKLVRHPKIFIPARKEMEFFYWERTQIHNRTLGLRGYARQYAGAGSRLKGDITPNYCVLPSQRVRYISRLMPDARLILLVRDPIERTWSAARRVLPRYFGRVPDDAEDIIRFLDRERWIHTFSDYPAIVDLWRRFYPANALLLLRFDEIRHHPAEALLRTLDHLELEHPTDLEAFDLNARLNVNPEMDMPQAVEDHLRRRYASILIEMEQRGLLQRE